MMSLVLTRLRLGHLAVFVLLSKVFYGDVMCLHQIRARPTRVRTQARTWWTSESITKADQNDDLKFKMSDSQTK